MHNTIRIFHECEGGIEKSVAQITLWHHEACQVMTNGDHEGGFFYLTRIIDSFSCSPLNTTICNLKMLPKVAGYAEVRYDMMTSL